MAEEENEARTKEGEAGEEKAFGLLCCSIFFVLLPCRASHCFADCHDDDIDILKLSFSSFLQA